MGNQPSSTSSPLNSESTNTLIHKANVIRKTSMRKYVTSMAAVHEPVEHLENDEGKGLFLMDY